MTTATFTTATQTITTDELADRLRKQTGTTFATLTTRTDARLKKTGNPHGQVFKVSRVNVCIGHVYENSVNNQRQREGNGETFTAQARQWGEHAGGAIVEHRGKVYLRCKVERSIMHRYEDTQGHLIDPDAIRPFMPAKRQAATQGVEKEIIERSYYLDSIMMIAIDGQTFIVNK